MLELIFKNQTIFVRIDRMEVLGKLQLMGLVGFLQGEIALSG